MHSKNLLIATLLTLALPAFAAEKIVTIHTVSENGVGEKIGTVTLKDSAMGLTLTPELNQLSPGEHGFHIHEKPSCEPAVKDGKKTPAGAAGGHYDPSHQGKHAGPRGEGHRGDLPALMVKADGTATESVFAPRLKLEDVNGRALMIHEGGDNYSDQPKPLGGGGGRIACGVVN
jgi:Cu-Zn family superoxide dismutase